MHDEEEEEEEDDDDDDQDDGVLTVTASHRIVTSIESSDPTEAANKGRVQGEEGRRKRRRRRRRRRRRKRIYISCTPPRDGACQQEGQCSFLL